MNFRTYIATILIWSEALFVTAQTCDKASCMNLTLCALFSCPEATESTGVIEKRSIGQRNLHEIFEKMQSHHLSQRGVRLRRLQPSEFLGKRSFKKPLILIRNISPIKRANEMLGKRSNYSKNMDVSSLHKSSSDKVQDSLYQDRSRRGPYRKYHGNEFLGKRSEPSNLMRQNPEEKFQRL